MSTTKKRAKLEAWSKSYEQEVDCCDGESEANQRLVVEQIDGGGGPYWLVRTERWAVGSIAELVAVLRDAGIPESIDEVRT